MKKTLLLSIFCFILGQSAMAQIIPNAGFDSVYIGGIDRLYAWGNSDGCPFEPFAIWSNVTVTYYNQNYQAARLRTAVDASGQAAPSFLFSSSFNDPTNPGCNEEFMKTGQPYPFAVDGVFGEYMFWNDSLHTGDYGTVSVILKKFNTVTQESDTIAYGSQNLMPTATDSIFEPFLVNLLYKNQMTPDSIVIIFYSSGTNLKGGVLTVDNLGSGSLTNNKSIFNEKLNIEVFPNPVSDAVNITINDGGIDERTNLQIFDIYGRMLEETQLKTSSSTFDMSHYSTGVYLFHFKMNDRTQVIKVVKR
jgi:hypothetical protein